MTTDLEKLPAPRYATLVDSETGERILHANIEHKKLPKWGKNFVTAFMTPLYQVSPRLTGEASRVLIYLLSTIGMNNQWTILHKSHIAEYMGMSRGQITRGVNVLVELGILIQGEKIRSRHTYLLNPEYAWRGKRLNYQHVNNDYAQMVLVRNIPIEESAPERERLPERERVAA